MRTRTVIFFIVGVLLCGSASAQFLGQMSPASIADAGTGKLGGYFVAAEDAFAVVGSVRYGFSEYVEGRFRFGFIDEDRPESDLHVILGIDTKYLLWKYGKVQQSYAESTAATPAGGNSYAPFDMSLGAGIEYAKLEYSSVLGIGGSVIGSLPYKFERSMVLEPYARLNLRYERIDIDDVVTPLGTIKGGSESDLEIGLNLGALFSVTRYVDFTAEFQIDDQMAFLLGIDIVAF